MGQRSDLQALLVSILGSSNVYFQPPESKRMVYPCIVYHRDALDSRFAGNAPYKQEKRYQVTIISIDPDSVVPDKVAKLPKCSFDRFYTADNLNHDVYNLYF